MLQLHKLEHWQIIGINRICWRGSGQILRAGAHSVATTRDQIEGTVYTNIRRRNRNERYLAVVELLRAVPNTTLMNHKNMEVAKEKQPQLPILRVYSQMWSNATSFRTSMSLWSLKRCVFTTWL